MNGTTKMYYSISEVCAKTGLESHVLRYWESEFSQLRPKKNRAGNRAYREKDILLITQIRHLLYEQKFTIPGAKKQLADARLITPDTEPSDETEKEQSPSEMQPISIGSLKNELGDLLRLLKS